MEGTSEKRIAYIQKIRSTFYTKRNLRKLLCQPKVATVDKRNIFYELDCSNCDAVFINGL